MQGIATVPNVIYNDRDIFEMRIIVIYCINIFY